MLSLNLKQVVDPELIPMGLGVFGSTFLATQLGDLLEKQANPVVVEYRRELVGAILMVGGTLMMRGSKELRTVGMAIGATGVAALLSGLVRRVMGDSTARPTSPGNGAGGSMVQPPSGGYILIA